MTRRRWLLLGAAALTIVLVLVVGVLALRPLLPGSGPESGSQRSTSPAPTTPPPPPPWESTQLPGYDSDPGPLELTPLAEATGEPVTVSLALEPDALRTGGTIGLSFDARELANPIWDSGTSNLTLTLEGAGQTGAAVRRQRRGPAYVVDLLRRGGPGLGAATVTPAESRASGRRGR